MGLLAGLAAAGTTEPAVQLPLTFDRVWYRAEKKKGLGKLKAAKATGHLTLTEESLEFASSKDRFALPLDRIWMISMGTMGQDVSTEWVLLSIQDSAGPRLIGVRDGRNLGYGQATKEIYESLRAGLRQLSAAQYDVPEGLQPYDGLDSQLVFAVPEGWNAYFQEVQFSGDSPTWGVTLFSSESIDHEDPDDRADALRQVRHGDLEAFFLGRSPAKKGMSCEGFSTKTRQTLLELAREDPLFGEGYQVIQEPQATPIEIGGCSALRVTARTRENQGIERALDLRFVADHRTLFVFGTRSAVDRLEQAAAPLDSAISTVRFALRAD
jgi:hypothetical protein